ncbi:MBL fold metallo-hydrolase [Streptomyces sp. NPDC008222]|uniref:MBL fold metallo-hydrolase n=1 Tax=Streptomyces sp. NPDC008222 TaxID=3364820 RepID=UPI0036EC4C99
MAGASLRWSVHVAPSIPTEISDLPPDLPRRMWSPITATLIAGERDAVLVDALMTTEQAGRLADWVAASGKNLTTVYVTYGHGDHWFGLGTVLERFPRARAVVTPEAVAQMRKQMAPGVRLVLLEHALSRPDPRQTRRGRTADRRPAGVGGQRPGRGGARAHRHRRQTPPVCRRLPSAWWWPVTPSTTLSTCTSRNRLDPRVVIAGHKRPDRPDEPGTIAETRQYIHDFETVVESATTALEVYQDMLNLHPSRINQGALWGSARSAKGS